MNLDDCYKIGQVIKAHGIKGEVVAELDVEYPEEFIDLESVFVEINKKLVPFFIDDMSIHEKRAIIKFEDVESAEEAKFLLKRSLYIPSEDLPELEEEGSSVVGILGFTVKDQTKGEIGKVTEYIERPGQDLLAVDYNGKEVYIPVDEAIILKVEKKKKVVIVDLPEGLLDL
jgi:16S rRNA processing protein RimM